MSDPHAPLRDDIHLLGDLLGERLRASEGVELFETVRTIGDDMRRRLQRAIEAVLAISGHRELVEENRVLRRSIDVRNPYVDPINLIQIELLGRLRGDGQRDRGRHTQYRLSQGWPANPRQVGSV